MRDLPTGTVTFLFTDIEGSTRLLQELGGDYVGVLEEHRRLLRLAFAQCGGVEVDTQGDAFFVVFERATDAVAAALAAQAALASSALRVRIGVHTGEPTVTDEGYVGLDVHRAARIMSAGHGGQILVSDRARSFLDRTVECRDLGLHRLKDRGDPERLHQVGSGSFPPLRTLDATNLPIPANALLGREAMLSELVALLSGGDRLVTLVGPGGTGKTRLALEAAAELVGRVADGVFWVPLAGVSDVDLVMPEIAQALGARDDLEGFLRERELLILVDNAEHLLDAAPALAGLLAGSRGLRLLVTSRAALRVSGEHELLVEPLEPGPAVELLRERARAVGREVPAGETAEAICRRLDGLPLAIELAAARSKLLGPEALLGRLDSALPLLTGGTRDAPERQRTLRAAIAWSYDLLGDDAKRLFASLSVFAGSFSLDAAVEVCGADLDSLAALVDASIVKAAGDERFLLLDTIREYAAEQLADSDEFDVVRAHHTTFFHFFAGENDRGVDSFEQSLELWRSLGNPSGETRALTGVCQLLVARGEVGRAEDLSRQLLELSRRDHDLRSEHFAIHFLADCALISADYTEAERLYRDSLRAALPLGDVLETSFEVQGVAMSAAGNGDDRRATRRSWSPENVPGGVRWPTPCRSATCALVVA